MLQSVGIVAGLWFTAHTIRTDAGVRRTDTLLRITQQHRDIWQQLYQRPELARVLDDSIPDSAITDEEAVFITFLILHLSSAFHAMNEGLFVTPEGLRRDIRWFLNLPIPKVVWEKSKAFQDTKFVRFVEEARREA